MPDTCKLHGEHDLEKPHLRVGGEFSRHGSDRHKNDNVKTIVEVIYFSFTDPFSRNLTKPPHTDHHIRWLQRLDPYCEGQICMGGREGNDLISCYQSFEPYGHHKKGTVIDCKLWIHSLLR